MNFLKLYRLRHGFLMLIEQKPRRNNIVELNLQSNHIIFGECPRYIDEICSLNLSNRLDALGYRHTYIKVFKKHQIVHLYLYNQIL